jgi:membrane protein
MPPWHPDGFALARRHAVLKSLSVPISWAELVRRTVKEAIDDDILGLGAQLAYYFFLALFPALLFLLAVASFFPLHNLTDDIGRALAPVASPEANQLIQEQMRRLAESQSGGLLTFGVLGALWSSSAAIVSIVGALNRAYDVEESRPWWKVRLIAIGLTLGLAVMVLAAFSIVLAGASLAGYLRESGVGAPLAWAWLILQWPLVFVLVMIAVGLVYYFGPDVEQDWTWITPGALLGTALWLVVSLGVKLYVTNFSDYNASYGAVGGVMVLLLWFYVSGIALILGAELNSEIEHASPHGQAVQKGPSGRRLIGARAARAYATEPPPVGPVPAPVIPPSPVTGLVFGSAALLLRKLHGTPIAPAPHVLTSGDTTR